jgi:hypothetical protein
MSNTAIGDWRLAIGQDRVIGYRQLAIGEKHSSHPVLDAQIQAIAYCRLPIAFLQAANPFTVTVPGTSVTNHGLAYGVLIGVRNHAPGCARDKKPRAARGYGAGLLHCSFGESSCIQ